MHTSAARNLWQLFKAARKHSTMKTVFGMVHEKINALMFPNKVSDLEGGLKKDEPANLNFVVSRLCRRVLSRVHARQDRTFQSHLHVPLLRLRLHLQRLS